MMLDGRYSPLGYLNPRTLRAGQHLTGRTNRPRSLQATGAAILALTLLTVGACSPRVSEAGRQVEATALWFSPASAEHPPQAGILPFQVTVSSDLGAPGFAIDVDQQAEEGAGASWVAASWSAAVAAVLATATNLDTVQLSFSVDGTIDGPSAGGMLAVAVAAGVFGTQVHPGRSMTGTIGPDGSIGPVSGIPNKIRAAHEAGLTVVAIPEASTRDVDVQTGEVVDNVALGRELGIRVVPVASIQHAYAELVGPWPTPPAEDLPGLSDELLQQLTAWSGQYQRAVSRLAPEVNTSGKEDRYERSLMRQVRDYQQAAEAAGTGLPVVAFGASANAYEVAAELAQRNATTIKLDAGPGSAVVADLLASAAKLEAELIEVANSISSEPAASLESQTSRADAQAWIGFGLAALESARRLIAADAEDPAALVDAAGEIGHARAQLRIGRDAATVAAESGRLDPMVEPASLLDSWSAFLSQAGDALVDYYATVVARSDADQLDRYRSSNAALDLAVGFRDFSAHHHPDLSPDAAREMAYANSAAYYVYGSAALLTPPNHSAVRARIGDLDVDRQRAAEIELYAYTAQQAAMTGLRRLTASGADIDYFAWNSAWGSLMANGRLGPKDTSTRMWGLTYIWYMNVLAAATIQGASTDPSGS